ncbi:low specificity L-threonine aldolase [Candidatus Bathyarchaeota archaeon]|nr:low specificity L-threonine aldolase [Candidatus Bathyarchaeota archaeon]
MRIVELRSDTFTMPTEEMLEAIKNAELGNDGYREDPTVNKLEDMAAEMMGKEDALLVTSGTQGNLVSLLAHTNPGEEVILGRYSHIFMYEVGSLAFFAGLMANTLDDRSGHLRAEEVKDAIRPRSIYFPRTSLVCIEDTHMMAGGIIVKPEEIKEIRDVTEAHNLKLHMDGARIFNAAVALGVDVKQFTRHVDSVMFCLSKGLSCPIGSIVAGDSEFIEKARRFRLMAGGGMRQAGIIAAPGIIALEKMIGRLREDHENARILAEGLSKIEGIRIDLEKVQTNIVLADISSLGVETDSFIKALYSRGVRTESLEKGKVRMVTHRGVTREDIEYAIRVFQEVVDESKKKDAGPKG